MANLFRVPAIVPSVNVPLGDTNRVEIEYICSLENDRKRTITADPAVNDGITLFEVLFKGHEGE